MVARPPAELDRYFRGFARSAAEREGGLIALLESGAAGSLNGNAHAYVQRVECPGTPPFDLLRSGDDSESYGARVADFSWPRFFAEQDGAEFIEGLRQQWVKDYDLVLIDSRTGVTDSGGVCTIQLPDLLVFVLTANQQNLDGFDRITTSIQDTRAALPYDRGRLPILPVLSRLDGRVEIDLAKKWLSVAADDLSTVMADWLPQKLPPLTFIEQTKLPHVPYYGFGESLAVLRDSQTDPDYLPYAYRLLTELIAENLREPGRLFGIENAESKEVIAPLQTLHFREAIEKDGPPLPTGQAAPANEPATDRGAAIRQIEKRHREVEASLLKLKEKAVQIEEQRRGAEEARRAAEDERRSVEVASMQLGHQRKLMLYSFVCLATAMCVGGYLLYLAKEQRDKSMKEAAIAISQRQEAEMSKQVAAARLAETELTLNRVEEARRELESQTAVRDAQEQLILGDRALSNDDVGGALEYFSKAAEKLGGQKESRLGAFVADAIGGALESEDRLPEAKIAWEQAVATWEKIGDPKGLDCLNARERLAHVLSYLDKVPEAIAQWQDIIPAQQRLLGPQHLRVLASKFLLAKLLHEDKRDTEAKPLAWEAYRGWLKTMGAEHKHAGDARKLLLELGETVEDEPKGERK